MENRKYSHEEIINTINMWVNTESINSMDGDSCKALLEKSWKSSAPSSQPKVINKYDVIFESPKCKISCGYNNWFDDFNFKFINRGIYLYVKNLCDHDIYVKIFLLDMSLDSEDGVGFGGSFFEVDEKVSWDGLHLYRGREDSCKIALTYDTYHNSSRYEMAVERAKYIEGKLLICISDEGIYSNPQAAVGCYPFGEKRVRFILQK